MKVSGYNNCLVDKNHLLHLLLVCLPVFDICALNSDWVPVFAIQKCDPAPFYLFDEVWCCGLAGMPESLNGRMCRSMPTSMRNIARPSPVSISSLTGSAESGKVHPCIAMIKSLASTGQFITTTFRPEMLVTADKFYGVLFNNQKVSSIRAIKREEAMEFVDQVCVAVLFSFRYGEILKGI